MKTERIDAKQFDTMLKNGLANLCQAEQEINDLNVFPVSDGDTGTNMRFTIFNGVSSVKNTEQVGAYLAELSEGMLLGARGNSGVILSQIFTGFGLRLAGLETLSVSDINAGFISGYKKAYETVLTPVEGTILTVCREGVENIQEKITPEMSIEEFFELYIAEMNVLLEKTPELLPVLKECGVVDSGALGYIRIIDGMLKALEDEMLEMPAVGEDTSAARKNANSSIDFSKFTADSAFIDGYCTEFILQLMNDDSYDHSFELSEYKKSLMEMGESLVVTQAGDRVKVHIHTKKPAVVIAYSQKYGEFLTFKLENMQLQHNDHDAKMDFGKKERTLKPAVHKPLAMIAVVNGHGMAEVFDRLNVDYIIEGSANMNASSEEFLDGLNYLDAEHIVILPNNKNTVMAAKQAIDLYKGEAKVTVFETGSMVEGYYVASMDTIDATIEERVDSMEQGMDFATLIEITTATKDYSNDSVSCKAGDIIGLINQKVVASGSDITSVTMDTLAQYDDIDFAENIVAFRGCDIEASAADELTEAIEANYEDIQITMLDGGQEIYHWMIGVI